MRTESIASNATQGIDPIQLIGMTIILVVILLLIVKNKPDHLKKKIDDDQTKND